MSDTRDVAVISPDALLDAAVKAIAQSIHAETSDDLWKIRRLVEAHVAFRLLESSAVKS